MKTKSYPAAVSLAYHAIMRSEVFRTDGNPIDLPRALQLLGKAVHGRDMDEFVWSAMGECTEAPLGDLIVGAYWALTEWHAGQSSPSYAAMCALGRVYSPGMSSGPEPESGEADAYELINAWFANHPRAL
jgi:hypothetical protein